MKVYVVQADNCGFGEDFSHWTEGVFSSDNLAELYIEKEEARYETDSKRIDELEVHMCEDDITDEEYVELCDLRDYWFKAWPVCPHYWIEEYEMEMI